jgi:hypothetical protein
MPTRNVQRLGIGLSTSILTNEWYAAYGRRRIRRVEAVRRHANRGRMRACGLMCLQRLNLLLHELEVSFAGYPAGECLLDPDVRRRQSLIVPVHRTANPIALETVHHRNKSPKIVDLLGFLQSDGKIRDRNGLGNQHLDLPMRCEGTYCAHEPDRWEELRGSPI